MNEEESWQYLVDLDERLLRGGVMLSEWTVFLIKEADGALVNGAQLASIFAGLAGVESHLRSESCMRRKRLVDVIEESGFEEDLKAELQGLRRFRNEWVHVADPSGDQSPLAAPQRHEREIEDMAWRCTVALRRDCYASPCI